MGAEHYPKANLKWSIVRFLEISSDDRKVIAKEAFEHLKSQEVDSYKLEALQTIIIDQDEIGSEAA